MNSFDKSRTKQVNLNITMFIGDKPFYLKFRKVGNDIQILSNDTEMIISIIYIDEFIRFSFEDQCHSIQKLLDHYCRLQGLHDIEFTNEVIEGLVKQVNALIEYKVEE